MKQHSEIGAMLAEHEFLRGMSSKHIALMEEFTSVDTFHPGDYVFRAGEEAEYTYLIRSGRISIEIYDPQRGAVLLETIAAEKVLGWSWLVPPYKWCFDARAVEVTRMLCLNAERLRQAGELDHEFGYEFHKRFTGVFAERLRAARLQLMDMYGPLT
ncbi:MAG: cyclic nucleotide-binding domain-containing protein [Candidatus Hydrogenedentes bacterium]|nr:cyclic nucleotide-binding domain-containing protein [Candidatus Hydrogenedentota bacterium]